MENIDTRATAFGRVLGALMERRGIPDSAGEMRVLFDRSGLGAEKYLPASPARRSLASSPSAAWTAR